MDAKTGIVIEVTRKVGGACSFAAPLHLLVLAVFCHVLAGCVHYPDISLAHSCEAYGVVENHAAMGSVVHMKPMAHEELQKTCMIMPGVAAMIGHGQEIRGCVFPGRNGEVFGYYSAGDRCAMLHEMCHAMHGVEHTERYKRDLRNGVPMPYCPGNQLSLLAGN